MTDPAAFVVVKTTIVAGGDSTEIEGTDVADVVKTDPLKSVVLNTGLDGDIVEPGIRNVAEVVITDPAELVVVITTTVGDGEGTEKEGTDGVEVVNAEEHNAV